MADDKRLTYKAPRAMRIGEMTGAEGFSKCEPGSGNPYYCINPGSFAAGSGCYTPGSSASEYGCRTPGNSAAGSCLDAGSGVVANP